LRAIVATAYGGPEVLAHVEIDPPNPTADQILIEVAACGVCGHDVLARTGAFPLSKPPFVMGHEIAGTVVQVGVHVSQFKVGDRVAVTQRISCGICHVCRTGRENMCVSGPGFYGEGLSGGYGDFVVASARNAVRVPDNIPLPTAAVLCCAIGTGFHALRRSALRLGETVVVTGASGGVGIHTIKLAKLMGLTSIAVSSSEAKADMLRSAGATHVVIAARYEFHEQVRALTHGEGADGVIEITGTPTFKSSVRSLRAGGRMVIVGNVEPGNVPFNPAIAVLKEIDFVGSGHATVEDLRRVIDLVARGVIAPIIADQLPRLSAAEAHRRIGQRENAGRIVLLHER
jgi:acryloyl-coenzyme A reductase